MSYPSARFDIVMFCERCQTDLKYGKIMSWFTIEVICPACSEVEDVIKKRLRKNGFGDHEDIGWVPNVPKMVLNRDIESLKGRGLDNMDIYNWSSRRFLKRHAQYDKIIEEYELSDDDNMLKILEEMTCWDAEELGLKDPTISNEAYLATMTKEKEDGV